MKLPFEPMELCRQALLENSKTVELGVERFPVRRTAKRGLRRPVSCCRLAPATTPPDSSVTTPSSVPLCAKAGALLDNRKN